MYRKFICAAVVSLVVFSFAMAETFLGTITEVKDGKVTIQKYKKGEKGKKGEKDGDPVTLSVAEKVKVVKGGKFDKDTKKFDGGDDIENGLKNEMFTKIDAEKGVGVLITTDDDKKVTEIRIMGGKKKKKADN